MINQYLFTDDSNQSEISNVQNKFLLLNQLWNKNGFLKCFQEMLTQFDIQTNLLKLPSGSRILTVCLFPT